MPNYITPGDVSASIVLTYNYLTGIMGDMDLLSAHDHSPSAGEGGNLLLATSASGTFVQRMYFFMAGKGGALPSGVPVELFSSSAPTGQIPDFEFAGNMPGGNTWGFSIARPTVSGDWYGIQCPLIAGVYTLQIMTRQGPCGGAASIELGTSGLGKIDTYSATSAFSVCTVSSIKVPTTASYLLRVIMSSANSLSASNTTRLGGLTLYKTSH